MNHIAQRRLDDKERRRGEIVDAADALARDLGWNHVTVDGVAKRARLSRALVYLYFKDKTDLHAALWERAKTDLHRRFSAAVANADDSCRFEAIGRAYIRFADEMPHYFEAVSCFEAKSEQELTDAASAAKTLTCENDVHHLMVSVLREGMEKGVVRADCGDLALTAVSLWAFTHGLIQISTSQRTHFAEHGIQQDALLTQAFAMLRRTIAATN